MNMFGGVAAMVNGNIFAGLFARSIIAKLSEADQQEALALDGSAPFDPMSNGRTMGNTILMSESVMDEPAELRSWLQKAFEHARTLPPKAKKIAKKSTKKAAAADAKPAFKAASKKPASRKAASKKPEPKGLSSRSPAKKPAAKRSAAKTRTRG